MHEIFVEADMFFSRVKNILSIEPDLFSLTCIKSKLGRFFIARWCGV